MTFIQDINKDKIKIVNENAKMILKLNATHCNTSFGFVVKKELPIESVRLVFIVSLAVEIDIYIIIKYKKKLH